MPLFVFRFATCLIALAISPATVRPQSAEPGVPLTGEWGIESDAFRLSLRPLQHSVLSGDPLVVTAVLQNGGTDAWFSTPGRAYFFDVQVAIVGADSRSRRVPATPQGKLATDPRRAIGNMRVDLRAGQEFTYTYRLDEWYDLRPPGTYRITFTCRLPARHAGEPPIRVVSNTLIVTVLPK